MRFHGRALDHDFVLEVAEPAASVITEALAPLRIDPSLQGDDLERLVVSRRDDGWSLDIPGLVCRPESSGRVVAHVLEHINQRAAASVTTEIPLHAAAVTDRSGGVVPLVGPSGAGKSTLAAAAVTGGWGFVADEVTAVDPTDLAARSYHRPIGLRRRGAAAIGIEYPDDEWFDSVLPWVVGMDARRPGGVVIGVVIVDRNDDRTEITDVAPARALVELIGNTVVPDERRIVEVFRRLDELVRCVPTVRVSYRTPAEGVAALSELAGRWRP